MAKTPRYRDIGDFIDSKNVRDLEKFIDQIKTFEEALDGSANKSRDLKNAITDAAEEYKDALDELGPLGKKLVKAFSITADVASDMTDRTVAFAERDIGRINNAVKDAIIQRIGLVKKLTDGVEKMGLKGSEAASFLRDYTGRIGGDITQWVTSGVEFAKKLRAMGALMAPIGLIVSGIVGAFILVNKIFTKSLERLTEIESATISIRKELGISATMAGQFSQYIGDSRENFLRLGVSSEQLASNITEVTEEFGFIRDVTNSELDLINTINARLGIVAGTSAGVLKIFNMIGDESREVDQNLLLSTLRLAEAGNVANAKVFSDIKSNSESILTFFRGTEVELAQSVIRARQLGLNISNITSTTEKLLDFNNSIESELNASVLLGRQINLNRARQLAFEGDLLGVQEELLRITKSVGDFDQMNAFQRQAISEALGLSVEEMRNMIVLETKLSKLTQADRQRFAELTDEQKKQLKNRKEITAQDISQMEAMGDMQESTTRIRNAFSAIIGNIVRLAQPAMERILRTVKKISDSFSSTFGDEEKRKSLERSFDRIAGSIGTLLTKVFMPENIERLSRMIEKFVATTTGIVEWLMGKFGDNGASSNMSSIFNRATTASLASTGASSGMVSNTERQIQDNMIQSGQSMAMALSGVEQAIRENRDIYLDGRKVTDTLARNPMNVGMA